jgi:predicted amidophosphoribosyltransferase
MPKGYPRTACKGCFRPIAECGSLSARGLCDDCGTARREANLACLVLRQGPYFDHWKRRTYMAALRLVLDDNTPER